MADIRNAEPRRVLIVGCGFPQLGLLRAARALRLYVVGVDANPRAIGVGVCDEFHEVSTHDAEGIASAARQARVQGLTSCGSEVALLAVAQAAALLGMPFYADVATVERCQFKDQMRAAYRDGGAPIPHFLQTSEWRDVERFVGAQGLPVVLKPSRGWGQRGVAKVELPSELEPAFLRAKAASAQGVVLCEEFVDGAEFSVNAYTTGETTRVYSVTERVITQYPQPPGITFAEWFPSGLDRATESAAIDAAIAGVRALGIRRGPSYTQLRVGSKGPKIIETAHRLGGGLDPDVAMLASGVSLYRKILGVALGRADWEQDAATFDPPSLAVPGLAREGEKHGGAIGKFLIGKPGRVVAIEGLDAARAMPGIVAAEAYVTVGGTVHPLTDGSKRAGHVLAFGDTRAQAHERAGAAASVIHIVTEAEG